MNKAVFPLVLWGVLLLCGCVGNYSVSSDQVNGFTKQGFATIQFSRISRNGLGHHDWTSFVIEKVDGANSRNIPLVVLPNHFFPLVPGFNKLSVRVNDFREIFYGNIQRVAWGEVSFYAEPGVPYVLNGFVDGDQALVWVSERDAMRRVTSEIPLILGPEIKTEVPVIIPIPVK